MYTTKKSILRGMERMERNLRPYNSTYPKGGVSCFADTFAQAESSVLRMKFSAKNPAHRVAANRQDVKKLHFTIK